MTAQRRRSRCCDQSSRLRVGCWRHPPLGIRFPYELSIARGVVKTWGGLSASAKTLKRRTRSSLASTRRHGPADAAEAAQTGPKRGARGGGRETQQVAHASLPSPVRKGVRDGHRMAVPGCKAQGHAHLHIVGVTARQLLLSGLLCSGDSAPEKVRVCT